MQTTPQISVKPKTSNGHEARTGERIKPGEQPKSTGQVKTGELKSGPPHVQEAPRSLRLNLSRSPLAAQTTTKLEKSTTPPATPKAPKVDPKARPEPKVQPRDRTIIEPSPAPQSGTPKRS